MTQPKAQISLGTSGPNIRRFLRSSSFSGYAQQAGVVTMILLALWGGGFGCLWCCASNMPDRCCEKRGAAMAHNTRQLCSSHRRCCQPTESNQYAVLKTSSQSAATHCCLNGTHTNEPAILTTAFDQKAPAAPITQPLVLFSLTQKPLTILSTSPANQGSAYLRCCVLLI